jgi:hypothetical protein
MTANLRLREGTHLAYEVVHEAWYASAPGVVDGPEINVSASVDDDGVAWEFAVEQADTGAGPAIRLRIWDAAFPAYTQIPEFFAGLAGGITTLEQVRALLESMGAVDETKREVSR